MSVNGYFVTGTDTEVGKTWVTAGLIQAMNQRGVSAVGMKPIASGCYLEGGELVSEDADLLAAASPIDVPIEQLNPYRFEPPIAPHLAAKEAAVAIDFSLIEQRLEQLSSQAEKVFVEGVGGWMVPLDGEQTVADLAQQLDLPVILVVGIRLGCINHALLTVAAIERSGQSLIGWVANCVDSSTSRQQDNIDTLTAMIDAPCLGIVPEVSEPSLVATHLTSAISLIAE